MARGWESKSVEAQQDAHLEARTVPRWSAEDAARRSKRDTLMLARTKACSDLRLALVPAHRSLLEQTIAEVDRLLALLD